MSSTRDSEIKTLQGAVQVLKGIDEITKNMTRDLEIASNNQVVIQQSLSRLQTNTKSM